MRANNVSTKSRRKTKKRTKASISFGDRARVDNSNVQIGDSYTHVVNTGGVPAEVKHITKQAVAIHGHRIKSAWVAFSSAIAFIASALTIYSFWQNLPWWSLLVALLFAVITFYMLDLGSKRFKRFLFDLYLQTDSDDQLYFTSLGGECPLCDGKLNVVYVYNNDLGTPIIQCSRNPDHSGPFDFTNLDV